MTDHRPLLVLPLIIGTCFFCFAPAGAADSNETPEGTSPGGYTFHVEKGKKPIIKRHGKFVGELDGVSPVSFSPTSDILLVLERGEDDDLRQYLLNIGEGELKKTGSRLDYVFGGRYFKSAAWSSDGQKITLHYSPAAATEEETFKITDVLRPPSPPKPTQNKRQKATRH